MALTRRQGKYQNVKMPASFLLDINMPKKNGFEVLNEISSEPALMHIPVVATNERQGSRYCQVLRQRSLIVHH